MRDPAWESEIRGLRVRLCAGAVLERLPAWAVGSAVVATTAVLLGRTQGWAGLDVAAWSWLGVALVGAAVQAWRGGWPTRRGALVRLEESLGLGSALSAADEGLAPWPPSKRDGAPSVVAFVWKPILLMPALGTALVAAAAVWPLPAHKATAAASAKPPSLEALEKLAGDLKTEAWVEPESAEKLEKSVEELAAATPDGWYSHGGLEAADALLEQAGLSLAQTSEALESGALAMAKLGEPPASPGDESMLEAANKLSAALSAMEPSSLPANEALRRALKDAAISPRSIDPETAKRLSEAMKRNASAASKLSRESLARLGLKRETEEEAQCRRQCAGKKCDGPGCGTGLGQGGVSRGPGSAPVVLLADLSKPGAGDQEGVAGNDESRAALGETIEQTSGRHQIDRAVGAETAAGGAIATKAGSADVVGVQHLTPAERRVVENFFK